MEDSETEDQDLTNYKGIYYGDDNQKFICPKTGAHFKHEELVSKLLRIDLPSKTSKYIH